MVICLIIFTLYNVFAASIDASLIKAGEEIKHWKNGLIYFVMLSVAFLIFRNWYLIAALCFDRLVFFNILLNRYRGLPTFYVSKSPASVTDKIFKIFGQWQYLIYLILFIAFTVAAFVLPLYFSL